MKKLRTQKQRMEGFAVATTRIESARKLASCGDFDAAHVDIDEAIRLGVEFYFTDRWHYFVSKAMLFDEQGNPDDGLQYYRKALAVALEAYDESANTLEAARFFLAGALAKNGEFEEALEMAPQPTSIGPAGFHCLRAICLQGLNEIDKARCEAELAITTSISSEMREKLRIDLSSLLCEH